MTMDGGWALIIASVLAVVLSGLGVLVWRHVDGAQRDADAALEEGRATKTEFLRFQTHVAENYAKQAAVERLENNIYSVLTRLEVKVDNVKDKISQANHGNV